MSRARPLLAAAVLLAVVIGMRAAGSPADAKTAQLPDDDARDEAASDSWDTDGDGGGALGAAEGEWEEEGEKEGERGRGEVGDPGEALDEVNEDAASFLGSRQKLQVVIHEPADGEVMWTEDVGANFDIFVEVHGGGFNYWDRGARIDADVFVGLQIPKSQYKTALSRKYNRALTFQNLWQSWTARKYGTQTAL